ncbi:MAG TPA: hypothetical protein DCX46_05280 [Bacteroidetes bacterium]|nr:MAG: hypothetical protein A2X68_02070 [Ignavibacteria bacterium GWC2_56_12]HAV22899.1 hypothetical protein [Bacteroidota bacterium]
MQKLTADRLELLIESSKILNSTLDLDKLLSIILDLTGRNLEAERGTIYLLDEERNELWSKVVKGDGLAEIRLPVGNGIAGAVALTGETVNLKNVQSDPRFDRSFDARSGYTTNSMLCMPMKNNQGKIIGVYQVINDRSGGFDRADEMFLAAFSEQVSVAIENARLHSAALEHERTTKELQIAAQIQQRLIPKTLPVIAGYETAASALPSKAIGGDFYDVVPIEKSIVVFAIADVSGKGIPAALLVSTLHASFRAYLESSIGLVELARKLNDLVHDNSPEEQYITFFLMALDTVSHKISYVNAGHCFPLIRRRSDGSFLELQASGLPLGLMRDMGYELGTVNIEPGDVLTMYTDGITEAINSKDEQFEECRLKSALSGAAGKPAVDVHARIVSDLSAFVGTTPAADDATIVILKRT